MCRLCNTISSARNSSCYVSAVTVAIITASAIGDCSKSASYSACKFCVRRQNASVNNVCSYCFTSIGVGVLAVTRIEALINTVETPRCTGLVCVNTNYAVRFNINNIWIGLQVCNFFRAEICNKTIHRVCEESRDIFCQRCCSNC